MNSTKETSIKEKLREVAKGLKGYKEGDDLLDINFHDSNILKLEKKKNKIILVIKIDTYWFPGKPFVLITLIDPIGTDKLEKALEKSVSGEIMDLKILRKKFGLRTWPVISINFVESNLSKIEVCCSNFWLDRFENYKNHKMKSSDSSYSFDMNF